MSASTSLASSTFNRFDGKNMMHEVSAIGYGEVTAFVQRDWRGHRIRPVCAMMN